MAGLLPLYFLLDGTSAILTLAVAAGFLSLARWSRSGLHYLVATGFTLLALGFAFVAASHFGPEVGEPTPPTPCASSASSRGPSCWCSPTAPPT
ncbi:MAG TPA: hypothetical protein VM327_08065 [Candidatus Thermoplasmatota archaeon]|nr:hypothetical protein [Candidatus Thermoplasmatota archaeon]